MPRIPNDPKRRDTRSFGELASEAIERVRRREAEDPSDDSGLVFPELWTDADDEADKHEPDWTDEEPDPADR